MSDTALTALWAFELTGLVGLFILIRVAAKRRAAGKERIPRPVRISAALLGLPIVVGFPVLMVLTIMNPSLKVERQQEKLVETGTPATATITNISETGTVINKRPQVRARLTVQPKDGPAFDSQWTWVFSVNDVQTYRVGTKVKVFFDPADHGTVAVVGVAPPEN
jgi:hypothetical protein